jgi:UDP-N-acetylmuramate dehydrogenase
MIIRDGGISGVVIRLGREFNYVDIDDTDNKNIKVTAGAATLDLMVAKMAMRRSAAGLEFFSGIPGSIGGAVRMNAGAYGQETKDVLIHATAIDRAGRPHELTPDDLNMTYRHTNLPDDWIVTKAVFVASPGDKELIKKEINQIQQSREESQPIREKTGGSTFANPPGEKAWKLIDAVGGRQLTIGGATMSDKHCNFMINTGHATAQDCEELGEELRRRVKDKFDITLRWEIKRIGRHQNSRRQDENGGNP